MGFSGPLETNKVNEHNKVKNLNWQEANQFGWGVELGTWPRTSPPSCQNPHCKPEPNCDLWISSLMPYPLGYAARYWCGYNFFPKWLSLLNKPMMVTDANLFSPFPSTAFPVFSHWISNCHLSTTSSVSTWLITMTTRCSVFSWSQSEKQWSRAQVGDWPFHYTVEPLGEEKSGCYT